MNNRKIISKFYRIRISNDLHEMINDLPVRNFRENQIGNHVYSGVGEMRVGSSYFPATIRVRLVEGIPIVFVRVPHAGISTDCPLKSKTTGQIVKQAILNTFN